MRRVPAVHTGIAGVVTGIAYLHDGLTGVLITVCSFVIGWSVGLILNWCDDYWLRKKMKHIRETEGSNVLSAEEIDSLLKVLQEGYEE